MRTLFGMAMVLLIGACTDGSDRRPVDPEDSLQFPRSFLEELEFRAGYGANDCGEREPEELIDEIHNCVTSAFYAYEPFFAIYNRQGIDSNVASGISFNNMELYLVEFDDHFCNPDDCIPYNVLECISPSVNDIDSELANIGRPFSCTETREILQSRL